MIPIVGGAISAIGDIGSEERQREAQQKLTRDQIEGAKELASYNQGLALDTWHKTNVGAQKAEYENAGMNPALMYGGSGGTGTTAGGSMPMPTGGVAASSAATTANKLNMGMQLAQMGLIKAQTENVEADTNKKEVDAGLGGEQTKAAKWQNEVNNLFTASAKADMMKNEKTKAFWESAGAQAAGENATYDFLAKKLAGSEGGALTENSWIVKQAKAEMGKAAQELQNAKTTGDILKAEKVIEQFKADLTKEGLTPDSPWYIKLMADFANKIGVNPLQQ